MDECGQPENNAVTCSKTTPYESGIKYEKSDGLTLTVRPSGTSAVTITSPVPPDSSFTGDLFLKGGGTLKIVLEGKVSVVNGADRTLVDFPLTGPPSRTIQVVPLAAKNSYRTSGVLVEHNGSGAGEIGIEIGPEARVGTADQPAGLYGAEVYFNTGSGDTTIVNRGEVYGHYRGMQVYYNNDVAGDVTIDMAKGSVTSMGVRVRSFGDVTIRNQGRIEVKPTPLYRQGSGTVFVVDGDNNDIEISGRYNSAVILVSHKGEGPGTREAPSGEIMIVSSGDIDVDATNGERYWYSADEPRSSVNGFDLHSGDGDAGSYVPITLRLTGGTVTATKHGAKVSKGSNGDGDIQVILEKEARIGTEENPVGGEGVWGQVSGGETAAAIMVTQRGHIHAKGSGVYAWHHGRGDVVVKHEAGTIKAGDKVGEFGKEGGESELPDLVGRTAGIFAFHGGERVFLKTDRTFKDAKIGKIEITSNADIESKGDGILAYVKDPTDSSGFRAVIPITVAVTGGRITAKGHGVHAEVATDYTNLEPAQVSAGQTEAGAIAVTVDEAATVMAEKDGVQVKGGGTQTVTINGKVMGGGGDSAGVRMRGGGTLMIGARAEIGAESGVAVKSNGKLTITMKKDDKDRIAWIQDKFVNDADMTTFEGASEGETVVAVSDMKTRGVYEGGMERRVTLKKTTADSMDTYQFKQESVREFREYHDRARVYEALPSVLLDLNRQTSAHARLSAARDGNGGWARVWFGDGEREADRSTTETGEKGVGLAWDFEHWGAEMGFDVPTSTEGLMLGVSAHYRDGEADVERGGRIDASGFGFGVSATYRAEEGLYVDGQVSYTRFDDIDLSSDARGRLASGLDADGYAVGLEVGRRMEMAERNVVLTPRGGLAWSSVDVDGFEDVKVEGYDGDRRVSLGSEDSFQGRIGVLAESADGRAYASLDVEHEFSEDRDVTASGARLDSETEATWARLGLGFRAELDETGEAVLSGQGFYALADGDNRDYGASVALRARF